MILLPKQSHSVTLKKKKKEEKEEKKNTIHYDMIYELRFLDLYI